MKLSHLGRSLVAIALVSGFAASASATSGVWDTALSAGDNAGTGSGVGTDTWITEIGANDIYAEWNVFDLYPVDNTPDVGGVGTLTELTGAAFLTGGGNIYSFAAPTQFTLVTDSLATLGEVWLRFSVLGTPLATTAMLNGVEAEFVTTYSSALGGFGGDEIEGYYKWDNVAAASSYTLSFAAVESSLSLDQVALYAVAAPVPEPESWALMVAGIGLVGGVARRRLRR